jgi:hypothetical protein
MMNLLDLPDSIQKALIDQPEPLIIQNFSERRLRMILTDEAPEQQVKRWTPCVNELSDFMDHVELCGSVWQRNRKRSSPCAKFDTASS